MDSAYIKKYRVDLKCLFKILLYDSVSIDDKQ